MDAGAGGSEMRVAVTCESSPAPRGAATEVGDLALEWRPLASLDPDRHAWRRLCERAAEPNVFYDPAFALAAAPALGAQVQAALVWSRPQPRRLLGFFPIRRERPYGPLWPVATGWTHAFAPLGTPLVDRDLADPVIGGQNRAALAPGEEREGYLTRNLSPRRRKELARLRRRLADHGTLELATARTEAEVASSLCEFLSLEARGWKGQAGTAIASNPAVGRFVSSAIAALATAAMVRIDRLQLEGRTLAAAITLQHGDTAWFWKIAFDEAYARCSPGVQLTIDLTAALLEDARITRVDSCAIERHPMIDHVWRERIALCDRLIAVDPGAKLAFRAARRLAVWRHRGRAAAKRLRDLLVGAPRPRPSHGFGWGSDG